MSCEDPRLEVTVLLGEEPPKITDGYGGWSEVDRPRRSPLTDFLTVPLYRLSISAVLDGYAAGQSVQSQQHTIEKMARPVGTEKPPIVNVAGSVPRTDIDWVVEGLEWDEVTRDDGGTLIRWGVTITLLQYVDPDQVEISGPGNRAKCKKHGKHKKVTVRKGDTLQKIAARELGSAKCWRKIASIKSNKIRDPKKLKVGKVLKMP